jgi:hypothetical protein
MDSRAPSNPPIMSRAAIAELERFDAPAARRTSVKESISAQVFAFGLAASFFLLDLVNILHHALWRDEMQVWIVAERSHSLMECLRLKTYEDIGHPDLWHVLVYPVSRLTSNPVGLQLLHMLLATMTAYVIARHSPFTRWQKALIVFGYFPFYEYAVVSHDYALGILAIFSFCAAFRPGPRKNYVVLAALLAVMAESNIYALMIALSFVFMMVLEAIRSPEPRQFLFPNVRSVLFAATLFFAVTLLSVSRMLAPADSGFVRPWHFPLDVSSAGRTVAMMWKVFMPVPEFSRQFWNSNIVTGPLVSVLSLVVLFASVLFFVRKPLILFLYTCGLGALFFFKHAKYAGFLRNDGHAFILFLACLWLAVAYPEERFPLLSVDRIARWFAPYRQRVLVSLLVIHVAVAVIASAIAFKVPFSQAKATAEFLRAKHMDGMFIVGDPDAPLLTLAGYLHREIYYLRGDRMGSYVIWNGKRLVDPKQSPLQAGMAKAAERQEDVLVIVTRPTQVFDASIQEVASFEGSVVGSEDYYIYLVKYEKASAHQDSGKTAYGRLAGSLKIAGA